jgi:hypothetical protein
MAFLLAVLPWDFGMSRGSSICLTTILPNHWEVADRPSGRPQTQSTAIMIPTWPYHLRAQQLSEQVPAVPTARWR